MIEVYDFYATWCNPCKAMLPIMNNIAKEYSDKIKLTKLDVDNREDVATKYQVFSVPTIVILKDKVEVDRIVGLTSKANIIKILGKYW